MVQAGIEIDHHASDLYVPDCPTARAILANHARHDVKQFTDLTSNPDGETWLDIPFMYEPFWEGKQ
jgi:hypothetical protein